MAGQSRRKLKSRKRKNRWLPVCMILAVLAGTACFLCVTKDISITELADGPANEPTGSKSPENKTEPTETDIYTELFEEETTNPEIYSSETNTSPTFEIIQKEDESTPGGEISAEETATEETVPKYSADAPDTLLLTQADPAVITLRFAGDILFDESYAIMASMLQRSGSVPDITTAFDSEMLSLMRGADLFMVNNEFPYSLRGAPLPNKQFTFRARPQYASLLKDLGADIVGLANNHVNDHGRDAMLDTFDTLDGIGMPFVGAGRNLSEASRIQYFTNGQVKIGIVAATQIERMGNPDTVGATEQNPGVFRCMNPNLLLERIREAKASCDCVIVFVHWGSEGKTETDSWQEEQAVQFADAGADVIIGAHPHVLQKIALVKGVPCVFSLGNYLFNSRTLDTGLAEVTLDGVTGKVRSVRFIPAVQSGCRTKHAEGTEKDRILEMMRQFSKGTAIDEDGYLAF